MSNCIWKYFHHSLEVVKNCVKPSLTSRPIMNRKDRKPSHCRIQILKERSASQDETNRLNSIELKVRLIMSTVCLNLIFLHDGHVCKNLKQRVNDSKSDWENKNEHAAYSSNVLWFSFPLTNARCKFHSKHIGFVMQLSIEYSLLEEIDVFHR